MPFSSFQPHCTCSSLALPLIAISSQCCLRLLSISVYFVHTAAEFIHNPTHIRVASYCLYKKKKKKALIPHSGPSMIPFQMGLSNIDIPAPVLRAHCFFTIAPYSPYVLQMIQPRPSLSLSLPTLLPQRSFYYQKSLPLSL